MAGAEPASYPYNAAADDDAEDDVSDEISDAGSDDLALRADCARHDANREAFLAQQRAGIDTSANLPPAPRKPAGPQPIRKGRKLGPRKAAKPSPDILFRLSLANESFERKQYADAIQMLGEVIRINSETYAAWTLLSTIHEELGDREKACMCLISAAHLVPKNVAYWINTALYALHGIEDMEEGPERERALERAHECYTKALIADKRNIEARSGKADVLLMQGQPAMALAQYHRALEYSPLNIRTVRNLADVTLDLKDPRRSCEAAKRAYRRIIDHLQALDTLDTEEGRFEWSDLRIYLEFFAILEQWQAAALELKEISRWLLGRRAESYWDHWLDDDREWDLHDDRRIDVTDFEPARYPQDSYGQGLPTDLRAKLYVYRHKLGQTFEADNHLKLLDPTAENAVDSFMDFPDCLKDIATALLEVDKPYEALMYLNLYKRIADECGDIPVDADLLVSQGRCHMALGDKSLAEECFIAAIEDDQDHIEARVQLANMYEGEHEQEGREEAFLLVREALNLEARRKDGTSLKPRRARGPYGPRKPREKKERKERKPGERKSKYVPRRLINAEKRAQQELEMLGEASRNYQVMRDLKEQVVAGDEQATAAWTRAAKNLTDDFRSYKQFYPWEKYIRYLGFGGQAAVPSRNFKLAAMAERLQHDLAPVEGQEQTNKQPVKNFPKDHRGIPFDQWLDIFLDYAFCLVRLGKHREAYIVCHAARDSIIWASVENTFLIHVAWASCAIYAGDEETCVAIARYFMRDYMPGTDSYRMFSAMCRVCQTPVSWYTSGPAQKFILRQIKTMDNIVMKSRGRGRGARNGSDDQEGEVARSKDQIDLDVCLLTIYGHILFTTTSYTYALSYLARAASIDPRNVLINLSIGLAYLHYALKRQATNRQYLLAQGFGFLFRYYHDRLSGADVSVGQRQEANFNIARAYSLIGLGNLAIVYYQKVLDDEDAGTAGVGGSMGGEDLKFEAAYNIRSICYLLGDVEGAKGIANRWLVL
ncbi:hypothetical protein B0T22DRAFT_495585 [Podospora appendiculata]|uniref:Transcription factor tau subunit sfc4 n=1 Tax=Podospora appendiculata TaxID=314037 RepID=A0AAE0XFM0_9PEZI|nr:hypothetical protein B0T22DRAFT_495585 [Podospora appendiculata]